MKQLSKFILFSILAVLLIAGSAGANNITIFDEDNNPPRTTDKGQGIEDDETEPGMINTQVWDLEGFFLDGMSLTVVAGFNLQNGYTHNNYLYEAGDIFIDIDGNAKYGTLSNKYDPNVPTTNYGYDYVFDVNWSALTYSVYQLKSGGSNFGLVSELGNTPESNPFRLIGNGETFFGSGTVSYESGLNNTQAGFDAYGNEGAHYRASGFDLGFLDPGTDFIAHLTLKCGNDNLMGSDNTPVPEPATMLLFGSGLIGIAAIGRKKFIKNK